MSLAYKRVLLKLSGEALAGENRFGLDYDVVLKICESIKTGVVMGAQIAIVVGGGNFWRGRSGGKMDRTRADHMGMLATVMNSLALADALEASGVITRVQTAINMQQIAEPYIRNRAVRHLEKNRVVIFGCGTGNPFFTTDTAAALRAAEIDAEVFFKATNTDGVYDRDPGEAGAVKFDEVSHQRILTENLQVMDATAASLCKENHIPIHVFGLSDPNNIVRALRGERIGTIVKEA
jgi:uridylate kinase